MEDVDGKWMGDLDGALTNLVNFDVADDVTHTVTLCATQTVWKADQQERDKLYTLCGH